MTKIMGSLVRLVNAVGTYVLNAVSFCMKQGIISIRSGCAVHPAR